MKAFLLLLMISCLTYAETDPWWEGTTSSSFQELIKLEPNPKRPSAEFLRKYLKPMHEVEFGFDKVKLQRSFNPFGPFVTPSHQLTTLHRINIRRMGSNPDKQLFLSESIYEPLTLRGLGRFLFILGHPRLPEYKDTLRYVNAIDKLPFAERPDLGLIEMNNEGGDVLPIAGTITEGERIFILHSPFLNWLSHEDQKWFHDNGPMVSTGYVISVEGRVAIANVQVFQGSSGGTVLNEKGEVLGVLSFSLEGPSNSYAGFMILDGKMKKIINENQ